MRFIVAGVALALVSSAAAAQSQGEVGTAAFERGRASGIAPQTLGEVTNCALYWYVWYDAIDYSLLSNELLASLPEETDSAASFESSSQWAGRAVAAHNAEYGNLQRMEAQLISDRPPLATKIRAVARGELAATREVLETLGTCHIPRG